jgi:hypothetical protein
MIRIPLRRRLAVWLSPAVMLGMLGLAACGTSLAHTHVPTAAEILQNATDVLNLTGTNSTNGASSATVNDLTFTMKLTTSMDMTSSSLGTQKFSETMAATGKETLKPRRAQMDMTMNMSGLDLTMTTIADYATETGYVKMSGLSGLPGASSGQWYKMSYASLGGLGADTSMYMDYSKLKGATLIGSDRINGVAVWHLRAKEDINQSVPTLGGASTGSSTSSSVGVSATTDYYFRQDNYRPVKAVIASTDTLSGLGTMTMNGEMDFTSFNTGISIALPPPSDVQSLQL